MSLFFFQAEDGIRDHCVTGVQTCALPIYFVAALPCRGQHAAPQLGKAYKILKKHDYVLKTVRWNIHARGVFTACEELYANNSARFALRDARTCEEQQVFLTPAPLSGDSSARILAPVLSEAEGPSGE